MMTYNIYLILVLIACACLLIATLIDGRDSRTLQSMGTDFPMPKVKPLKEE